MNSQLTTEKARGESSMEKNLNGDGSVNDDEDARIKRQCRWPWKRWRWFAERARVISILGFQKEEKTQESDISQLLKINFKTKKSYKVTKKLTKKSNKNPQENP
jgi:hypothetical protein